MALRVPEPYVRPTSVDEALVELADGPRLVVAGGTDVYAAATRPIDRPVLDVSRVDGLRGITREADGWRLGATTTWTDIADADWLPGAFDGLRAAARQVGGRQVQNMGTIGGNVANASPAADGTPNLLALDAVVECASMGRGVRRVPLAAFMTGYRATALAPDELITGVLVPPVAESARATFTKLGSRAYLVISIVSVAAVLEVSGGSVSGARIAVGACSPVPVRLHALEAALVGAPAGPGDGSPLAGRVTAEHLAGLAPIDDVRAPAAYRLEAALALVRRAVAELCR